MYDRVESRDAVAIAIAQEDTDLESHGRILHRFKGKPSFEIVADIDRKATPRYERTTTYLIDLDGVVRQVFPSLIHHRPDWTSIFGELDRIQREREAG